VFEDKGFIETRVSDILKRAGVSHGTYYDPRGDAGVREGGTSVARVQCIPAGTTARPMRPGGRLELPKIYFRQNDDMVMATITRARADTYVVGRLRRVDQRLVT
jgi:hypothetical protein